MSANFNLIIIVTRIIITMHLSTLKVILWTQYSRIGSHWRKQSSKQNEIQTWGREDRVHMAEMPQSWGAETIHTCTTLDIFTYARNNILFRKHFEYNHFIKQPIIKVICQIINCIPIKLYNLKYINYPYFQYLDTVAASEHYFSTIWSRGFE